MSHSSCRKCATRPRPALRRFTVLLIFLLAAGAVVAAPALAAGSISGTVFDEDGWSVDAVRVDLWMSPDGAQPYVWAGVTDTGSAGGYVLTTPGSGSYRLSFSDPFLRFLGEWWSNKRTLDEANDVWVNDGETRAGINAILSAAGRAGGVVTAGGAPVEGIRVDGFRWSDQAQDWVGTSESYTDASGAWSTLALPPGEYRFHFRDTRAAPEHADRFWDGQRFWDNAHQVSIWGGRYVDFINAELETGAFIGGVVQDEWGGPIEGAVVTASGYNPNSDSWPGVRQAVTNALGQYTLGPLAPGDFRLWFQGGPAWLAEWWDDKRHDWEADATSLEAGQSVVRNATLAQAGTISGHVTADGSGDPGAPLEGIAVSLYRWNGWDWWGVKGGWWFTDADGFYSVGGLEPGAYRVQFIDPNGQWAGEYYDDVPGWTGPNEVPVLGGIPTVIDASLGRAGRIEGYVRDESMNPLQGIDVAAWLRCGEGDGTFWDWVGGAQSEWDGHFVVNGLPAGVHQIELSDPNGNYAGEVYEDGLNFGQGYDLVVEPDLTTWAYPVLAAGGRLYGQVVGAGGEGLGDVQVTFHGWIEDDPATGAGHYEWYTECWTDRNGDFSMPGLMARPTLVNFWDASGQHLSEYYDDAMSEDQAKPVVVPGGGSRNLGVVELGPAGHIAGIVTSAGGDPLAGIEVTVARWREDWNDWDHFAGASTDENGWYDVSNLAAGSYRVGFRDPSGAYVGEWYVDASDSWSGQDVEVEAGDWAYVDAALDPAAVIEGHVRDALGNPLSGIEAILYFQDESGGWTRFSSWDERTFTGGDGSFRFGGLPAQKYQLRLENGENPGPWAAEVFDGALVPGTGTDLVPAPGETLTVDPVLDVGGTLTGRLLDDEDFTPLSFAFPMSIEVWTWIPDAGLPEGGSWRSYAEYATGDGTEGYIHGVPLQPGEYRVDFDCWPGAYVYEAWQDQPDLEHADPVTIAAGETTNLGNVLMQRSAMIFGHVTRPGGEPAGNVPVRAWRQAEWGWEQVFEFWTWEDGYFQLGNLSGGEYYVEADGLHIGLAREYWQDAASLLSATSLVLGPREEVHGIDIELAGVGGLEGTVRTAGGELAPGASVHLAQWDGAAGRYVDLGDDVSNVTTDADGYWRIGGVTPGTYRVTAGPSGAYAQREEEDVVAVEGEMTTVDITLPLGATISGTIRDMLGSPYPTAVEAFAWSDDEDSWLSIQTVDAVWPGFYTLGPLAPGTYRVSFGDSGDGFPFHVEMWDNRFPIEAADDITVSEGEAVTGIDCYFGSASDVTPPSAPGVTGADDAWHAAPVELVFEATDVGDGVEEYECSMDGGPWRDVARRWYNARVTVDAPADHSNDGVRAVAVRAVDYAGNVGEATTVQVKIDTTGPVVTDDAPGGWLRGPVTVSLSAVDAGCGVVDRIEYAAAEDGPWTEGSSFTLSTWKRGGGTGERTTWVRGVDALGNVGDPAPVVVRLDGKAPQTTHDSDGLPHDTDVTVHLTLNDPHSGPGWTYFSLDGGPWLIGSTVVVPALASGQNDGVHWIWFYSVDAVGNVEPSRKSCTVEIDVPGVP